MRFSWGADDGAQVHNCRGVISGRGAAGEVCGLLANLRHDFINRFGEVIEAADDTDDIAVDDGFRQVECQGQKTGNGIAADTFEFHHFISRIGEASPPGNHLRRTM